MTSGRFDSGLQLQLVADVWQEIEARLGPLYVFSHKGGPVKGLNGAAFKGACKVAALENFRFHDIRHTWHRF